jgi:hypothetical protein
MWFVMQTKGWNVPCEESSVYDVDGSCGEDQTQWTSRVDTFMEKIRALHNKQGIHPYHPIHTITSIWYYYMAGYGVVQDKREGDKKLGLACHEILLNSV